MGPICWSGSGRVFDVGRRHTGVAVLAKLALRDVPPCTFVWLQIVIDGSLLTLYPFQWRGEPHPAGPRPRGVRPGWRHRLLFFLSIQQLPGFPNPRAPPLLSG